MATDERWRGLLDAARDAYISIDAAGDVVEWNRQAERLFGWSRDEAVGNLLADMIIPEEFRDAHLLGLQRFTATGRGQVVFQRLQLPALHRSGRRFDIEFTIWPSKETGGDWLFHAFLHDVSADVRQRSYLQLLNRVAAAANEANDVEDAIHVALAAVRDASGLPYAHVYLLEPGDGDRLAPTGWWSPSAVEPLASRTADTRLRVGEGLPGRVAASGRPAWISDLDVDRNFPRAAEAARSGLRGAFAFPITAGPDVVAVVEMFSHDVLEPDPELLDVLAIVGTQLGRVFERQRAWRELRAAAEQREAIVTIVGHELRGPLATAHAASALLATELEATGDAHGQELLDLLDRELARLRRLVDNLLTAQRLDARSLRIEPEDVAIGPAARQVAKDADAEASIEAADDVRVRVDADHLTQILWNLITNAVRHGRPPVTLSAETAADGTTAIAVRDAGEGVPESVVPRLFDRFVRGAGSAGSGLGLAIARGLARANHGELDYRTAAEGGPAFVLTLPAGRAARTSTPT